MKNNFKHWDKEKLKAVSIKGGKATKGISKSFPNRMKLGANKIRTANKILDSLGRD
jgi:hypothetical protein